MKKKGFTLIELLVVIAIIAMLLAILMPALNKVKKIAQRVVCGTNLKGLGTAQVVYANDYDDEYAVQGGGGAHTWGDATDAWFDPQKNWRTDIGRITVGASLFLLVREADVSTKSFLCPSGDQQEYEGENPDNLDIVELWDFASITYPTADVNGPQNCVSYSYHTPYAGSAMGQSGQKSRFAADGTRSASFAVMADQNPFFEEIKLTRGGTINAKTFMEKAASLGGGFATATNIADGLEKWQIQVNNAQAHGRESQNVLFGDGHTSNERRADVGIKNDNIWTAWSATDGLDLSIRKGNYIPNYGVIPRGMSDSVLVNDGEFCEEGD